MWLVKVVILSVK